MISFALVNNCSSKSLDGSNLNITHLFMCVRLLPHIRGNVGLVFTKADLSDVRKVIDSNKVKRNCCIM